MPTETAVENGRRPGSRVPAYQRIEEDIREKVKDGRLLPGTMLASRHNLARDYGVALSTAQQAVANLVADGVLETFDRRGTFVTQRQPAAMEKRPVPAATILSQPTQESEADMNGSQHRAPAGPIPVHTTSATLGIVATARIDSAVSPDVGSLWARLAIRSLEHVFSAAGGTTRFFERYPVERGPYPRGLDESNAFSIPEAIASLRADGCDAIAVVGLCDAADMSDEVIRAVDVERVSTVYISWHEVQPPLSQVYYDNRFAGYQAAQHLLRQGYKRLVLLEPFVAAWLTERISGARDAIRHANLPDDTLQVYAANHRHQAYDREPSMESLHELAKTTFGSGWQKIASNADGACAIIAPNDDSAFAVLEDAAAQSRVVGRDFGLLGFDDDPRACAIGLTTVRPPIEAMGEEAGQLLLRSLNGDKRSQIVRLRSHVIPRASTSLKAR